MSRLCFEGPEDQLMLTANTQPAVLTVSIAAQRLLASRGIEPAFVAGHSLGEYSANVAAGTFDFADAVRIVSRRGHYMQDAVPVGTGAMAAVLGLDADKVAQACEEAADGEVVSPANLNGGGQVVIAGARDAVARAGERARALGAKRVVPLPVSAPFHCALMKPAADRLAPELRALAVRDPRVPDRGERGCRTEARGVRNRRRDRGACQASLITRPLGRRGSPPCVGRRHNVC